MADMQGERTAVQIIAALAATGTWHPFSGTHDCVDNCGNKEDVGSQTIVAIARKGAKIGFK